MNPKSDAVEPKSDAVEPVCEADVVEAKPAAKPKRKSPRKK